MNTPTLEDRVFTVLTEAAGWMRGRELVEALDKRYPAFIHYPGATYLALKNLLDEGSVKQNNACPNHYRPKGDERLTGMAAIRAGLENATGLPA